MKTPEEIFDKNTKDKPLSYSIVIQSMKEYALEVAREALKNAIIKQDEVLERFAYRTHGPFAESLRESILDDKNIPEL
jgi:Tfp pilus assembly protein PilE